MGFTFKSIIGLLGILLLSVCSQAQNYCTPKHSGNQAKNPFFTYIYEVQVGNLTQTLSRNNASNGNSYRPFLSQDTLRLARGGQYQLNIALGNGANTQTVSGWVDFNQDRAFNTNEQLFTQTDFASVGNHRYQFTFNVPSNIPKGVSRLRLGTIFGTSPPNPCQNGANFDYLQHFHDYVVKIVDPQIQQILNITSVDTSEALIPQNGKDQKLLGINIATNAEGTQNPINLDSLLFDLNGTDRLTDLSQAKLFQGTPSQRLPNLQVQDSLQPSKGSFPLKKDTALNPGNNFFWLGVDVDSNAIQGNQVNSRGLKVFADRAYTPQPIDPKGTKTIDYCLSRGNQNNFVFIDSFGFKALKQVSGSNNGGYNFYSQVTDTFRPQKSYEIALRVGNGANPAFASAWIDLDQDGNFEHPQERVWDTFYAVSGSNLLLDTIQLPPNLAIGSTRLRVGIQFSSSPTNTNLKPEPCTNPLAFGEAEDYTIYLTDSNRLKADFGSLTLCQGDTAFFQDASYVTSGSDSVISWQWEFGDGNTDTNQNPAHLYDSSGFFPVRLTVTSQQGKKDSIQKWVRVEDLELNFSYSDSLAGNPVQFLETVQKGAIQKQKWQFNDSATAGNDTSVSANPTHQYDSAGTYPVSFTATSKGGCRDTTEKMVTVYSTLSPQAFFRLPEDTLEQGVALTLKDQSRFADSIEWAFSPDYISFQPGYDSTSPNPMLSFDSTGTYQVQLIAKNAQGKDTLKRALSIEKPKKPVALISASERNPVAGQPVTFTDQSLNNPTYWEWYLGDQDTVYKQHPRKIYQDTGKKAITLIVGNAAGYDTVSYANWLEVNAQYQLCQQSVKNSERLTGQLTDDGGRGGDYSDNKQCGFTIEPSCPGELRLIFDHFAIDNSDDLRIYDGNSPDGEALHPGSGFDNNNSVPDTLTSDSGAFYIELLTSGFSSDSGFLAHWEAKPNDTPIASITYDTPVYINNPQNLTAFTQQGSRNTFSWDLDEDGTFERADAKTVNYAFPDSGRQPVYLEVTNCRGTDVIYDTIPVNTPEKAPRTLFAIDPKVSDLLTSLQLTDTSLNGPTAWEWWIRPRQPKNPGSTGFPFTYSFLNGTSAQSQNPEVAFFEPGHYKVCLATTNQKGTDTLCKPQSIYVRDDATLCDQDSSTFLEGYLLDDGGRSGDYSSNLNNDTGGDGICRMTINPCAGRLRLIQQSFDVAGDDYLRIYDGLDSTGDALFDTTTNGFNNRNVPNDTLIAQTGSFHVAFESDSTITEAGFEFAWRGDSIEPHFTFDSAICPGEPFAIKNQTPQPSGIPQSHEWQLPDTTIRGKDTFEYAFAKAGTYPITLKVNTNRKCQTTITRNITVHPKPEPGFSWNDPICEGDSVFFKDQSQITKGSIDKLQWQLNDSAISQDTVVKEQFNQANQLAINLTAQSTIGCTDSFSQKVTVRPNPEADFESRHNCNPDSLLLLNTSQSKHPLTGRQWHVDTQGFRGNKDSLYFAPQKDRQIPTVLTVQDSFGCRDSTTQAVPYNPSFKAKFSIGDTCAYAPLPVNNQTDTGITGIQTYYWWSGDRQDSAQTPGFTVQDTGMQLLRLQAVSAMGCVDTFTDSFQTAPSPEIDYRIKGLRCPDNLLTFQTSAQSPAIGVDSLSWIIRDTNFALGNPDSFELTFPKAGWQNFQVKARGNNGCPRIIQDRIKIHSLPNAGFTYKQTGYRTLRLAAEDANQAFYQWYLPTDTIASSQDTIGYQFDSVGLWKVGLKVTADSGCQNFYQDSVAVLTVSREALPEHPSFSVYPNPFRNTITISRESHAPSARIRFQLRTLTGKILRKTELGEGAAIRHWSLPRMPKGTYILTGQSLGTHEPVLRRIVVHH